MTAYKAHKDRLRVLLHDPSTHYWAADLIHELMDGKVHSRLDPVDVYKVFYTLTKVYEQHLADIQD